MNTSLNDNEKKDILKKQYELIEALKADREYPESETKEGRNDFQRDYARILYSPSFRRLQGKMQINGIKSSAFYRNRLTHSLEVAQIATSIALKLSYMTEGKIYNNNDIFVLEAAALGHDIGHPAFGHKGERVLDEIAKQYGLRFEGNAQNFRILRKLEHKYPKFDGLNLTIRTLLAINKYITKEDKDIDKFMYKDDFDYLDKIRKNNELEKKRTLDVQIIELADDIAYAVHDLEDGLHLKKFNIDEILYILKIKLKDKTEQYNEFEKIIKDVKEYNNQESEPNVQKYSKLFRFNLTSKLIDTFVNDITIKPVNKEFAEKHGILKDNDELQNDELQLNKYGSLLKKLKNAVFDCSTRDTNIQEYEMKGEIIIKSLFNIYTDLKKNIDGKLLPHDFRSDNQKQLIQNSIDYIAGMMDTFAISEYERLFNAKFDNIDLSQNVTINAYKIKKIAKKFI